MCLRMFQLLNFRRCQIRSVVCEMLVFWVRFPDCDPIHHPSQVKSSPTPSPKNQQWPILNDWCVHFQWEFDTQSRCNMEEIRMKQPTVAHLTMGKSMISQLQKFSERRRVQVAGQANCFCATALVSDPEIVLPPGQIKGKPVPIPMSTGWILFHTCSPMVHIYDFHNWEYWGL